MKSVAVTLLIVLSAAFGSAAEATPLTRVTFVTDWKAQAEHGGFYEAQALGLYRARGLDVKIVEGGPAVNVPQMLAGGAADFGIGSNGLIAHPRADVKKLADMKGKPVMIADASIVAFWPWLKAKYGFSDSQIRKYTFNLAPFLVNIDAIQEGYLTSEPYTIEREGGFKPQVFLLADNGYPGYANMVLARQKWIDSDPATVRAFVNATREGWIAYLFKNPAPANALIKRDNPEMSDGLIAQAIEQMKRHGIVVSGDVKSPSQIGLMTDARWKTFFDTMSSEGLYPKSLPYRTAYDLRFVAPAQ